MPIRTIANLQNLNCWNHSNSVHIEEYLYLKSIKKCNTYYLTCSIYTTLFKNQFFASATDAVFGLPSVFVLNVHPHVRSYANIHRTGHCKYGSIYLLL